MKIHKAWDEEIVTIAADRNSMQFGKSIYNIMKPDGSSRGVGWSGWNKDIFPAGYHLSNLIQQVFRGADYMLARADIDAFLARATKLQGICHRDYDKWIGG